MAVRVHLTYHMIQMFQLMIQMFQLMKIGGLPVTMIIESGASCNVIDRNCVGIFESQ